jgi:hypothetical protein
MSTADLTIAPEVDEPSTGGGRRSPRPLGVWARVVLGCALLAGSGALRYWQQARIEKGLKDGKVSPVPLEGLPKTLGDWEGRDEELDPQIARLTGSTDHVFRTYVDGRTGVALDVIVLYGPAVEMKLHAPEQCYPAAGYETAEGPDYRAIETERGDIPFCSLVFTKGEGGQAERQEVYYTWRYGGRWTPHRGAHKEMERTPSMYKVHLARRLTEREARDAGGPCEDFLKLLLPAMERLIGAPS